MSQKHIVVPETGGMLQTLVDVDLVDALEVAHKWAVELGKDIEVHHDDGITLVEHNQCVD